MNYRPVALFAASTLALTAATASAQEAAPATAPAEEAATDEAAAGQIVVVATRIPGEIETGQPPVITLNEAEIASYGASSIQDLLTALPAADESGCDSAQQVCVHEWHTYLERMGHARPVHVAQELVA